MSQRTYTGGELPLFEKAGNWKSYWSRFVAPYVKGEVLEAGAGIGANTQLLSGTGFRRWVCLEPDAALLQQIPARLASCDRYDFVAGTLAGLDPASRFDTVLYIDVLEHIEDDRDELVRAASHLRPDGCLIILSPAHQSLFTPFDKAIGHYRRYTKRTLAAAVPGGLKPELLMYLDCAGLLASLMNRVFLKQSMPSEKQILTWDRFLVPVSAKLDGLLRHKVGKSVFGVWRC